MATTEKRARMTVDLGDPTLYRAIRHAAIEQDRSVREIVGRIHARGAFPRRYCPTRY